MHKGFVKLYRKFVEWEWYSDAKVCRLFIHLILTANWKDKKWRGNAIKRGQKLTSLQHLSDETGLSVKSVRTALKKLKMTNEVAVKTANKFSIITLINYDFYQEKEPQGANKTASESTNEGQAKGKQRATTKEVKELEECEELKNKGNETSFYPVVVKNLHNGLLKALAKISISPEEFIIAEKLIASGCTLNDVEAARKKTGKNNLKYLQNIVCEFRDKRISEKEALIKIENSRFI